MGLLFGNILTSAVSRGRTVVTEKNAKVRNGVCKIPNALGSGLATPLHKVPDEDLGKVLHDL